MSWMEKLQQIKQDMETNVEDWAQDALETNDVMSTLEDINPRISKGSKTFKESNRYIFKQPLSYENAEKIMDYICSIEDMGRNDIKACKNELHNICSFIVVLGESPVEMLVYATKGIQNNHHLMEIIKDELKELSIFDKKMPDAFRNILRNWNWVEQLRLVIDSIVNIKLHGLEEDLLGVFEKNIYLREQAGNALISLEHETYYENIINLLLALNTDSTEVRDMINRLLKKMARYSSNGSEYIFKAYMEDLTNPALQNIFIAAIRLNPSSSIFGKLEKYMSSTNMRYQRKADRLLSKMNNHKTTEMLDGLLKGYTKGEKSNNKELIARMIGTMKDKSKIHILKNIADDESNTMKERITALISIAYTGDEDAIPYMEGFLNKSPEFEIASASSLVQMGKKEKITNIFKYIVSKNTPEEYVRYANSQINRLRTLRIDEINKSLIIVARKLLLEENEFIVLNVIKLFTQGMADDDVADVLLYKLMNTQIEEGKLLILEYLSKNFSLLSTQMGDKIRNTIVECSKNNHSNKVKTKAMQCLKRINSKEDFTPVSL